MKKLVGKKISQFLGNMEIGTFRSSREKPSYHLQLKSEN